MSRICLKRKQPQKKLSLCSLDQPVCQNNQQENNQIQAISSLTSPTHKKLHVFDNHNESTSQNMLQQYKIKYNELKQKYDNQRIQNNELSQQKKRIQIQLLSSNSEFYEREIKRLKNEIQKLQQFNQDYKHKYIVSQNCKKQLQATVKVRNQQIKRSIQLLEKQKIMGLEFKHNLIEKQKIFQRITGELQQSNQVLSKNYQDTNNRLQKIQVIFKNKSQDFQTLQYNYDQLAKRLSQSQKSIKITKQIYQQNINKKNIIIDQLQMQIKNLNKNYKQTIQNLQQKIIQLHNQKQTQILLIDKNIQCKNNLKQQRLFQLQIIRLEQMYRQLQLDYNDKCKLIKTFQTKLLTYYTQDQYKQLSQQLLSNENRMQQLCSIYEQKLQKYEKQIQNIKLQKLSNPLLQKCIKTNDFEQLLKNQLQQNIKIKKQFLLKLQQISTFKTQIQQNKLKQKQKQQQIIILNKKLKSLQKNYKIQLDIFTQNLKNQIDCLKRKINMMQSKIQQKNKQNKQKQNFIMNTIMGRSKQEDVPFILKQMQRIFQTDYNTLITALQQKLELYENSK